MGTIKTMNIQKNDNQIIITIDKGPDNLIYNWLKFNTKKKLTESMQKSIQFDQLADSLKLIMGASASFTPQKIEAVAIEQTEEAAPINENEIITKLRMF